MVKRYTVTLSDDQDKILDALPMGNNKSEKIRSIVISWMTDKSFVSSTAKKRLKLE